MNKSAAEEGTMQPSPLRSRKYPPSPWMSPNFSEMFPMEKRPRAKYLDGLPQTADVRPVMDCLYHYNTHRGDQYEPLCPGDCSSKSALPDWYRGILSEAKPMSTRPTPLPRSSGSWDPIYDPLEHTVPYVLEVEHHKHWGAPAWGHSEQLAMDHQLVMNCLQHYNSMHLGVEYEPAPGKVTQCSQGGKGTCWTHGNFVARRKPSGWFSFLPAPQTLFFFELAFEDGSDQVVTCTPLLDEHVTEAYSVLGCPLWSTWRSGSCDSICKTCKRRLDKGILACGHKERERLCKMCYLRSDVLHPSAGEFAFGYEEY